MSWFKEHIDATKLGCKRIFRNIKGSLETLKTKSLNKEIELVQGHRIDYDSAGTV